MITQDSPYEGSRRGQRSFVSIGILRFRLCRRQGHTLEKGSDRVGGGNG